MLQDVLSEMTKSTRFSKLRVFVHDNTAFMNGGSKELVEMAEQVLKKLKSCKGEGPEDVDH